METKELNVISLNGLKKLIKEIFKNPNKTIKESYQNLAVILAGSAKESFQNVLSNAIADVNFEVMCLTKECFASGGITSTKGINETLKAVKSELSSEFSSMNGEMFLKLIRDSVVHNSKENSHTRSDNFYNYEISLKKNKAGETADINLSKTNLLNYMYEYDQARRLDIKFARLDFDEHCDKDVNTLLASKKKHGKFQNFIQTYNMKGQEIEIDNFQENAYLRFLLKYKKYEQKVKNFDYFKTRFFPFKDNKIANFELKSRLLGGMMAMYLNMNQKNSDIVKTFKNENDVCGMFCFMDEETLLASVYSSICFSMVSSRTNEELFSLLTDAGCGVSEDVVSHIRNSFIHGRYFYNYKNGFEIYDGTKDLNHYATFDFEQIDKLYNVYTKENVEKIKKARTEFKIKKILEEEIKEL